MHRGDLVNPIVWKTFPRYLFAMFLHPCVVGVALASLLCSGAAAAANAQTPNTTSHVGSQPVFRLDGGNTTYAFGVNERGELQQLYWGGRIAAADAIAAPHSDREWASFDSSYNDTPQEYPGWGAGLFQEPALKVT